MINKRCFLAIFASVFLVFFSSSLFADILDDIVVEVNFMRSRPQEYVQKRLVPRLKRYKGIYYYETNTVIIETKEGVAPLKECIKVLKKQKPLGILTMDKALVKAALRHAKDQARTGQVGHQGSDGSDFVDRIKGAGYRGSGMGENIQYGCYNAIDIVADLMIDDGVPSRGHRINLLGEYNKIGVAFIKGGNACCGAVCVMDYGLDGNASVSGSNNGGKGRPRLNVDDFKYDSRRGQKLKRDPRTEGDYCDLGSNYDGADCGADGGKDYDAGDCGDSVGNDYGDGGEYGDWGDGDDDGDNDGDDFDDDDDYDDGDTSGGS